MNKRKDTIFALATPTGKSAIAVIRISGQHAHEVISKISLNIHDAYQRTLGCDTNERTFKSLGLNGILISDKIKQLENIFPNIKTSNDSSELVRITKEYLSLTEKELNNIINKYKK